MSADEALDPAVVESLRSRDGHQAIYREGRRICRVRVTEVSVGERSMTAWMVPIITPGLMNDDPEGWSIGGSWMGFMHGSDFWSIPYVGVRVLFDADLLNAVVAFAATLPPDYDSQSSYQALARFLREFQDRK